jgi:hypothetical protein
MNYLTCGMTIDDVKKLLGVKEVSIDKTFSGKWRDYIDTVYTTSIGDYVILWSVSEYSNPVVLGWYSRIDGKCWTRRVK